MNLSLLKYAGMKSSELTTASLTEIASAFGYQVEADDAMLSNVTGLLREGDVHALADLVSQPKLIEKLTSLFKGQSGDDNLIICPHCSEFINQ